WLPGPSREQLVTLHNALITFFKLAGIDRVCQQGESMGPEDVPIVDLQYQAIGWDECVRAWQDDLSHPERLLLASEIRILPLPPPERINTASGPRQQPVAEAASFGDGVGVAKLPAF